MLTLERLNQVSPAEWLETLAPCYPGGPWIADAAMGQRPYASQDALLLAMVNAVRAGTREQQDELLSRLPPLAPQFEAAALEGVGPGRGQDAFELSELEGRYLERFGFPFALAPIGPAAQGLSYDAVVASIRRRVARPRHAERAEALRQLHRHAELWLAEAFSTKPQDGERIWEWAESLALHRDSGPGQPLTVTYLTPAHQACAVDLMKTMHECGFDAVRRDALGSVVGVYKAAQEGAPRLLTGSHFDTVRNAGRYDGRLGIFVPLAVVRRLAQTHRRLPFAIEVVGFAEEEGQRFSTSFLGSAALTGKFQARWLDLADANGVSMRDAMRQGGLTADLAAIAAEERNPGDYLGFVEVHIEQGPVLSNLDLPLGVVTSINGSVRSEGEFVGMASHAGTTPMDQRHDAALGAAELALYLEKRAGQVPGVVGTMGILEVPSGSINVVPGRCRFTLDIRAPEDGARDACVADVLAEIDAIAARRGLSVSVRESLRASASPCAPEWQERWARAVESLGLPVHRMPSGAGHDAMQLHTVMPQAMLFVRGQNDGISHNPLEAITTHDAQRAVDAFAALIDQLAGRSPAD